MQFSEKLNFLMDITKTSNSALSFHASVDASYISRLRRGKRLMPKNEDCIRSMAAYFSKRCTEDYQQKAVGDALNLSSYPHSQALLLDIIVKWLMNEKGSNSERVENFLGGLSKITSRTPPSGDSLKKSIENIPGENIAVYYGVDGKQNAVRLFLSEVIARDNPQTLLLFSDEETTWMTENKQFAKEWAFLMMQTLAKNNRIKIIHTINRDLNEMLNAISQWMPLYMSGAIEPYFYPKKRDGIFKRTLFIAPETAAIVSSSVGGMTSSAANVLFRDQTSVASFEQEFLQYLRLCRPLMRIFTGKDRETSLSSLTEFEAVSADTLIKTESVSILTMPEDLHAQISERAGMSYIFNLEYHNSRIMRFKQILKTNKFIEIIYLPDNETLKNGMVKIALSEMMDGGAIYYTQEEFIRHLENIIMLLHTYDNYHVYIANGRPEENYMVYAKEESGVIVAKTSLPPVLLYINESNLTAAFWDFLNDIIDLKASGNPNNISTADKLSDYVKKLKEADR